MQIPLPQGFEYAALAAGFKQSGAADLGLVLSKTPATAAATFTTNRFQAAPVIVGMERIAAGAPMRGICINSGQANACTGEQGLENCRKSMELLAASLGISHNELLPASTGVIGVHMDMEKWSAAAPKLVEKLTPYGAEAFARAIMTTDAFPKIAWRTVTLPDGNQVNILGIAKGAGMICPNMATMLSVVLCDAQVEQAEWRKILKQAIEKGFNRVTVDGDTSTNDTVYALANGASGITPQGDGLKDLAAGVEEVCLQLAKLLVADGEGGTKVIRITVQGAADNSQAEQVARTVGHSQLVKTAFYGKDANWGRIVAAIGRSNATFSPDAVRVVLNDVLLFDKGAPVPGDKDALLAFSLREREQHLAITLGSGSGEYELFAADLTHEYVSINADYTT